MYITESLCCMPEINTICDWKYSNIEKELVEKRKYFQNLKKKIWVAILRQNRLLRERP